jgi:ATP-dependent Clp protease ATP-binding subunit ClpC
MTGQLGDEPYRPGKLSRAVASLLGLSTAKSLTRCSNTKGMKSVQEANADLLDRLTPAGRRVLDAARNEAWALGQSKVGTEHLLLALTRDPESGACRVLEQLGAIPSRVQADVLGSLVSGAKSAPATGKIPPAGPLGLTPRARLAVQLGHRASARIGVPSTAPEHLLIGLAAEAEGVAAKALRNSGITARTAEKRVTSDLDGRA